MKLVFYCFTAMCLLMSCQHGNMANIQNIEDNITPDSLLNNKWTFFDIVSRSGKQYYSEDPFVEKYKNMSVLLTDSLFILDNEYQHYYTTEKIVSDQFFENSNEYNFYYELLRDRYGINIIDSVESISLADSKYVECFTMLLQSGNVAVKQDGFLFLEDGDNIICYKSPKVIDFLYQNLAEGDTILPFVVQSFDVLPLEKRVVMWEDKFSKYNLKYKYAERFLSLSSFTCDSDNFNYYPLPQKKDLKVALVPANCGDFFHVFLLVVNKEGQISSLYVDGLYSSHEDLNRINPSIMQTHFSIDEKYNITVYTNTKGSETHQVYQIQDDGQIEKVK